MSNLEGAKLIMKKLIDAGYETVIVGGYVRDRLLGIENGDIDIATNAYPEVIQNLFEKTIPTGIKHGTITVLVKGYQYEVTTFRTEGKYLDNRRPEHVSYVSSFLEDVNRRDFTMNALGLTYDEILIDYVNGHSDIKNKIIRAVGNPYERFSEDALRMLRAFRFVSKLGFSVEQESLNAIKTHKGLMENIAYERILTEIEKMITGKYFTDAISQMVTISFHEALLAFKTGIEKINETGFKPENLVEFLSICSVTNEEFKLSDLPISNQLKRAIALVKEMYLLEVTNFSKLLLFRNGLESCLITNKLNCFLRNKCDEKEQIISEYQSLPISKVCDLKFKGEDIINVLPKKPGSWIGDLIDEICIKVLFGELNNDYQEIKEFVLNKNLTD